MPQRYSPSGQAAPYPRAYRAKSRASASNPSIVVSTGLPPDSPPSPARPRSTSYSAWAAWLIATPVVSNAPAPPARSSRRCAREKPCPRSSGRRSRPCAISSRTATRPAPRFPAVTVYPKIKSPSSITPSFSPLSLRLARQPPFVPNTAPPPRQRSCSTSPCFAPRKTSANSFISPPVSPRPPIGNSGLLAKVSPAPGVNTERVRFLGFLRDPAPLYAAADIAVHASASESLSNFLIEAQAHGLPAVAYAAQGIGECFIPGRTGWVIARDDRAAFHAALAPLFELSDSARAELATAARGYAHTTFDPARQVTAYLELFARLHSRAQP